LPQKNKMTTEQQLDSIDTRLEKLVVVSEQQARSIERLAGALTEQARAISSLSRTVSRLVDASQRSAQAAEMAAGIAQSNQVAIRQVGIRDLIEELKRDRNN
jgi:methyl-accepting chemotaxis protein